MNLIQGIHEASYYRYLFDPYGCYDHHQSNIYMQPEYIAPLPANISSSRPIGPQWCSSCRT